MPSQTHTRHASQMHQTPKSPKLLCMVFDQLKQLQLPASDYAVFGSGPLIVRSIIPFAGDLDVICRPAVWDHVASLGQVRHLPRYNVDVVEMHDGKLTFGQSWGIGDFAVDELIDSAEMIDGLPFVRLEYVVAYKRERNSDKDRRHLRALDNALSISYRRAEDAENSF